MICIHLQRFSSFETRVFFKFDFRMFSHSNWLQIQTPWNFKSWMVQSSLNGPNTSVCKKYQSGKSWTSYRGGKAVICVMMVFIMVLNTPQFAHLLLCMASFQVVSQRKRNVSSHDASNKAESALNEDPELLPPITMPSWFEDNFSLFEMHNMQSEGQWPSVWAFLLQDP